MLDPYPASESLPTLSGSRSYLARRQATLLRYSEGRARGRRGSPRDRFELIGAIVRIDGRAVLDEPSRVFLAQGRLHHSLQLQQQLQRRLGLEQQGWRVGTDLLVGLGREATSTVRIVPSLVLAHFVRVELGLLPAIDGQCRRLPLLPRRCLLLRCRLDHRDLGWRISVGLRGPSLLYIKEKERELAGDERSLGSLPAKYRLKSTVGESLNVSSFHFAPTPRR